jgi:hypothetical protein
MNNSPEQRGGESVDQSPSKDEIKGEQEKRQPTASKPGGFVNDPDDPSNPNEVRERHLRKLNP